MRRVSRTRRIGGCLVAVAPACGFLSTWLSLLLDPDAENARSGGIVTALALPFALY